MAEAYGTGHYVGNFLFLEQDLNDDFMLEGDDIVIVDEADTLNGTGLEDAYNGGYYYNWVAHWMPEPEGPSPPFAIRPLNGILRRERPASPPFARADQYRWMIGDRVSFTQSLEVSIENIYAEVGSRWKSVVFWYQLPVPVTGAPSPGRGRRPRARPRAAVDRAESRLRCDGDPVRAAGRRARVARPARRRRPKGRDAVRRPAVGGSPRGPVESRAVCRTASTSSACGRGAARSSAS